MIYPPNRVGEPYVPPFAESSDPYKPGLILNAFMAHLAEWINLNYPPKEAS